MLKVYAKETFAVGKPGDLTKPLHLIHANKIDAEVPDWAAGELTFRRAVEHGLIEVINSREEEIKAEHKAAETEKATKSRSRAKAADAK